MNLTNRLAEARAAAQTWATSKPRTAKRNQAAAETIEAYVEVDAMLDQGAALPVQWSSTTTLPSVEEIAEALAAVGMMMPIESARVTDIARAVVKVMGQRRSPRVPADV